MEIADHGTPTSVGWVEEYDPDADVWTMRAPMPTPQWGLGLAAGTDGKLYALGGLVSYMRLHQVVEAYDPVLNTWSSLPPRQGKFDCTAAVGAGNGRIYTIGGHLDFLFASPGQERGPQGRVEEFDPTGSATWHDALSMPTPRQCVGAVVGENLRIYAVGGAVGASYPFGPVAIVEKAVVPTEPNDAFEQAMPLVPGVARRDTIPDPSDADTYWFGVTYAPATVSLTLGELPADYDLELIGPDRSVVAISARPGNLSEVLVAGLDRPGTYYAHVSSARGGSSPLGYELRLGLTQATPTPTVTPTITPTFTPSPVPPSPTITPTSTATATATPTITPTDPYEPNNNYGQAARLSSGLSIAARIFPAGDVDYFRVEVLQPGSTISVALTGLPADYDLYLDRPDQSPAGSSARSGTQDETITYNAGSATGDYYVVVIAPAGAWGSGTYVLRVTITPP